MLLTTCDLLLDPLATSVEAWTWAEKGIYFGIPLLNFIGWFAVAMVIYLAYLGLQALSRPTDNASPFSFDLTWMFVNAVFVGLACLASYHRLRNSAPVLIFFGLALPYWGYWFMGVIRYRSRARFSSSTPGAVPPALVPVERSVAETAPRS